MSVVMSLRTDDHDGGDLELIVEGADLADEGRDGLLLTTHQHLRHMHIDTERSAQACMTQDSSRCSQPSI